MKAVLDEAGRIQLPEDVRSQLGVKPGDEVVLEARAGEWVLKSAQTETGLSWEGNVLVHKGSTLTDTATADSIDQARNERFRRLTEGLAQ